MKVLVIGDPHFKKDNSLETDSLHRELENHLRSVSTPYDFIVCLGDVVDQVSNLLYPLDRINSFFQMLIKYGKLYVLIGNHDRPNNQHFLTEVHPFNSMKMWDREKIVIADKGLIVRTISGKEFWFVPYVPPGRFFEALNVINSSSGTSLEESLKRVKTSGGCIFSHQEFYASKLNIGIYSEHGDKWGQDGNYPVIINGHIHQFAKLQSNILHVGTPYQTDMGDLSPDKGVIALNLPSEGGCYPLGSEGGFGESSCSLGSDGEVSYQKIPLNIRQKISISVSAKELISSPNDVYMKFAHLLDPNGLNSFIRLVISQTKEEKRYIDASKLLFQFENLGIKIKREFVKEEQDRSAEVLASGVGPVELVTPKAKQDVKQENFQEKLLERISNDPELLSLYQEIFQGKG